MPVKAANRRMFVLQVAAGASAFAAVSQVSAQTPAKVDPKDPQAAALGYVEDTKKVDQAKFPKHTADQACAGCQLFSGKPKDASGPCGLFAGKAVAAGGWCSAWVKKA
jgi:hypothetical protein